MQIITMSRAAFAGHIATHAAVIGYYKSAAGVIMITSTKLGMHAAVFVDEVKNDAHYYTPAQLAEMNFVLSGTPFQQKVWRQIMAIPAGVTVSYERVARAIGRPAAHRAVANAIGDNKISYFIPCHRVVRKDGSLGGYAWGLERKRALLKAEKVVI